MTMESQQVQNLVAETGKLETQERLAFWVQRLCAVDPGITSVADEVQRQFSGEFLLPWGEVNLCRIRAFSWLEEAHLHYEGQYAFLKDHWLKLNIIQNTFTKISRITLNHISRHRGPDKLIKINHRVSHCYGYSKIAVLDVVCLQVTEIHSH